MHVNADVFRQLPHRRQRISLPDTLCGNSDDDLIPQLNVKGLVAVKVNFQYHRLTIFRYICYIKYITFQIVPPLKSTGDCDTSVHISLNFEFHVSIAFCKFPTTQLSLNIYHLLISFCIFYIFLLFFIFLIGSFLIF